jgi:DNA-binding CsgD family transcriptional regulator
MGRDDEEITLPGKTTDFGLAAELIAAASYSELKECLYAGARRVFGPVCIGLDLLDPDSVEVRDTSAIGVSDYFLARYDKVARRQDPVLRFAVENRVVAHNLAMMTPAQWRSSQLYEEVFALHRMTSLVYAPIIVDDRVVATLNLGSDDSAGEFDAAQLDRIAGLSDLLGAVLGSLQRRGALARRVGQFRAAIDLCEQPVVVSDLQDGERHVNPAARAILAARSPEQPSIDEELANPSDDAAVGRHGSDLIRRSVPVEPRGLVTFLLPGVGKERLPEWLVARLTPREVDVVTLVAHGHHDSEIGEVLMLSTHTVKGYLRDIYRKLDIHSRVDLTRMAATAQR